MLKIIPSIAVMITLTGCVADNWQDTARVLMDTPSSSASLSGLSTEQIVSGLKEALRVGSSDVVSQLGKTGGFNLDPKIRIPLPATLAKVDTGLKTIGMGQLTDDLQVRMNNAAEQATAQALPLFINAIQQMTIADARSILSGQQDAATQYLRKTMGTELAQKIQPIVGTTLQQAGAVQAYDRVMGQYAAMPLVSGVKTDLNNFVTEKAMDGIFYYVAREEAAIRANPAKRTTEILRTVFGGV